MILIIISQQALLLNITLVNNWKHIMFNMVLSQSSVYNNVQPKPMSLDSTGTTSLQFVKGFEFDSRGDSIWIILLEIYVCLSLTRKKKHLVQKHYEIFFFSPLKNSLVYKLVGIGEIWLLGKFLNLTNITLLLQFIVQMVKIF